MTFNQIMTTIAPYCIGFGVGLMFCGILMNLGLLK